MSSSGSPLAAMDKALQEVEIQVTALDAAPPDEDDDVTGVRLWYDRPENHDAVLSLIGEQLIGVEEIPSGPSNIFSMGSRLRQNGFRWYVTALNDKGRAATGIYTVRSLVAGLATIGFGRIMEPLGLKRFDKPPKSAERGQPDPFRQTAKGYKMQPFA